MSPIDRDKTIKQASTECKYGHPTTQKNARGDGKSKTNLFKSIVRKKGPTATITTPTKTKKMTPRCLLLPRLVSLPPLPTVLPLLPMTTMIAMPPRSAEAETDADLHLHQKGTGAQPAGPNKKSKGVGDLQSIWLCANAWHLHPPQCTPCARQHYSGVLLPPFYQQDIPRPHQW